MEETHCSLTSCWKLVWRTISKASRFNLEKRYYVKMLQEGRRIPNDIALGIRRDLKPVAAKALGMQTKK